MFYLLGRREDVLLARKSGIIDRVRDTACSLVVDAGNVGGAQPSA